MSKWWTNLLRLFDVASAVPKQTSDYTKCRHREHIAMLRTYFLMPELPVFFNAKNL